MAKVILLSQFPLPYSKTGSWTSMYYNYLKSNHQIDYLICESPESFFETVNYECISNNIVTKLKKKFLKQPYFAYLKALEDIINTKEKYIIQIVDNFGIVKPLELFLVHKGLRKNCHIQFFYHGFPPFYENFRGRWFFETIDEMILLTHDSYLAHKNTYTVLPTRFSVLHNGIDTSKFYAISKDEKEILKKERNLSDKKIFVWCSQDRPKKGLHILLDAWKRVYEMRQDIVLWVIGCEPKDPISGVEYLGRIPNSELPKYYQTSDCYLFPTLWHEGFGLSLIEALHCGCYCIASANGGVPEVLQYGKLGKLIENPNFVEEWENAILEFLRNKENPSVSFPKDLYSSKSWNLGMNKIIENAKRSIQ
ncbi:glycosyltransferase involved in cell wall biosynthesis [Flavobacterium nitrogenifigens]|uniref:Glycosyltransferase involved in cell wall biosynthesis n=2 Tax=Flavobacterium TaxID=237 RepID=A0A7W7IZW8_9FLAO|nr:MULTISPECIES: glycosyltransferase family 4 protein [Flavobacterium]MBB4803651.1 glycosyltransferase involved in cell wall biosynthesis [Flavobacterium nitrogenifigens]MBB6388544.1 glycosyltransferase involved in cell wall biosynthesis [Flavobacterium notoginsengisoli]